MSRLTLLLTAPLLLALTPALHAQQLADLTPHPIYPQPDAHIDDPWSPASNLNKRFPLQVRLTFQDNHFNGYFYTGTGTARLSGSSLPSTTTAASPSTKPSTRPAGSSPAKN